jgi:ABC-type amino acid transport substrate-binding protein
MIGVGFLGAFAKPVVTMPLLLNVAEIPSDIFNLYLSVGVFAARFGDLMKAMHLMAFSTMTAAALAGAFRVRWRRLLISGGSTLLLVALTVVAIRGFLDVTFADAYSKKQLVTAAQLLLPSAPSEVTQYAAVNPTPFQPHEDSMQRILRRGCIRVGFRPDELPFSYFNQDGELVGLDIDMAHQLARDLGVRIEFVPCPSDEIDALHRDYFDIAMSGYNGTVRRATELPHTSSYMEVTVALVVPDYRTREFRTGARLPDRADVRIAVVQDSAASELSIRLPASVEVVEIPTERVFFETQPPPADALATSAEAGSAWTLQYPQFKVVRPAGFRASIPLYYLVARESQFEEFLEGWLALKRRDGTVDQLYDYWILGKSTTDQPPRWCILRDVLHWID